MVLAGSRFGGGRNIRSFGLVISTDLSVTAQRFHPLSVSVFALLGDARLTVAPRRAKSSLMLPQPIHCWHRPHLGFNTGTRWYAMKGLSG